MLSYNANNKANSRNNDSDNNNKRRNVAIAALSVKARRSFYTGSSSTRCKISIVQHFATNCQSSLAKVSL